MSELQLVVDGDVLPASLLQAEAPESSRQSGSFSR